ncbi:MAG: Methylase of polypeptide chain release factor [Sphingomonas bacterium]|nr:Methylase of polypeptide chain release factor [Sphingomonas bacterium]
MSPAQESALLALLDALEARGYTFVTPTPATHARILARPDRTIGLTLRDVFGWSLPFEDGAIDGAIVALAETAGILETAGPGLRRSLLRVSSLHQRLFLHSAYPTIAEDAVFLGPDSYRFADLILRELDDCPAGARIVDIGTGAGVGAIVAAGCCADATVVMTDINPRALEIARINAAHQGVAAEFVEGDGLAAVSGAIDVVLINPPYIADDAGRAYRDGGEMHGGRLSLDLATAAGARLSPGGRLLLYTGSAIIAGHDPLREALEPALAAHGCDLRYREIDPDVFGEELDAEPYADVERIALVAAVGIKRG